MLSKPTGRESMISACSLRPTLLESARCAIRVLDDERDQVRIEVEEDRQAATILECRPPWRGDYGPEWTRSPIARLRYVSSTRLWTLYYQRDTGRWERYPLLGSTPRLAEIDHDPICIFWG